MPYAVRRMLRTVLAAGAALASLLMPPAAQAATCPAAPTSKPFARFGDTADYSLLSNGHFESGTSGWSLHKASVAAENESYRVRSASDQRSLGIKAGGRATSPNFCVGAEHPTFRFFARRTSGTWGVLNVKLRWKAADGRTRELFVGSPAGDPYKSWRPTDVFVLGSAIPLAELGGTATVELSFEPEKGGGDWLIDDVYIDPYRR